MSPIERASQRNEQTEPPVGRLFDETVQPNLARGIVWADVLADIAADEEARRRRDDLPDAA